MNTSNIIGHQIQLQRIQSMLESALEPQAILFTGRSGIGKSIIAKRLLMTLFCKEGDPCLVCKDCNGIAKGSHPDVLMLETNDKGTIPLGDDSSPGTVRWLISRLSKKSQSGHYGVIINGAENLSAAGQNALLKTLEEPPQGTLIVLIATGKQLILPTILSRVTEISFQALSSEQVFSILSSRYSLDSTLATAANICGGSVGIASLLMEDNNLQEVEKLLSSITNFIVNRGILNLDLDSLQKKIGAEKLLFILTNSFRSMLLAKINGVTGDDFFSKYSFLNEDILTKLIKITLSLSRNLDMNLILSNSFKGMLYSIDTMKPTGLPTFD